MPNMLHVVGQIPVRPCLRQREGSTLCKLCMEVMDLATVVALHKVASYSE